MTMYHEENVTGQYADMSEVDKALKGRREAWQPTS